MEYLLVVLMTCYLVPFTVAAARNHPQVHGVLALNLLAGWTGVGWVVCLLWAGPPALGRPFAWMEPEPSVSPRRRRASFRVVGGGAATPSTEAATRDEDPQVRRR